MASADLLLDLAHPVDGLADGVEPVLAIAGESEVAVSQGQRGVLKDQGAGGEDLGAVDGLAADGVVVQLADARGRPALLKVASSLLRWARAAMKASSSSLPNLPVASAATSSARWVDTYCLALARAAKPETPADSSLSTAPRSILLFSESSSEMNRS